MRKNKGFMRTVTLFASAAVIAGMSILASNAVSTNDKNDYIKTADTAADSIQAVADGAVNSNNMTQIGSVISIGTHEGLRIALKQTEKAIEAEEARKAEEEKKKAEEEASKLTTAPTVNENWDQSGKLNTFSGVYYGPSGKETFYNLDMSGVVSIMRGLGYSDDQYPYWVRDDGCKMFGDYIIVACNLDLRPRGTLVATSLGMGIVCDTSPVFIGDSATQVDVAVTW